MVIQFKEFLHLHDITVRMLWDAMFLRGHSMSYKDLARYGRCYQRDNKPRWKQIEECLKDDFGIELPW